MEQQITEIWRSISTQITLYGGQIILALGLLIAGWWTISRLSKWIAKHFQASLPDETLAKFLSSAFEVVLKTLLIISVAGVVGIETTSFVAILGAAGLAVGLALQGSLSNFAGGVMILLFRPIQVGEYVEAQGLEGTVDDIGIFVTTLKTFDERIVIVPNGPLANGTIINHTRSDSRAVEVNVGISYSDDIPTIVKAIDAVIERDYRVIHNKPNVVAPINFGDSSIDLLIRAYVKTEDYWSFYFSVRPIIKQAIENAGGSIPFPQRDVHLIQQA